MHVLFVIPLLVITVDSRRLTKKLRTCVDPPDLKDQLAAWMKDSLKESLNDESDTWGHIHESEGEPAICNENPRNEVDSSIMQRALCPWRPKLTFEETREPKMISASECLCRKSRGSSGAFCLPIIRNVPILRRISCDLSNGYWTYTRSTEPITVGCHSVLPRTSRALYLTKTNF